MATQAQGWFSKFVGFLETEATAAEAKIKAVAADLGPVVVQYGDEFLSSLAEVAVGAVLKQAPLVISGSEKFGNAVAEVVQNVETQGKTIALQDAHAVVQAAFNKAQAKAGA